MLLSFLEGYTNGTGIKVLSESYSENMCEEQDILMEFKILYNNRENISIHVTPDGLKNVGEGGGYFKVARGENYKEGDKCARINFCECEYVMHHGGRDHISLEKDEKDMLMVMLNSPLNNKQKRNIPIEFKPYINNCWQYLIFMHNKYSTTSLQDILTYAAPPDAQPPKLYNKPNIVRFNIPIPDYTKL